MRLQQRDSDVFVQKAPAPSRIENAPCALSPMCERVFVSLPNTTITSSTLQHHHAVSYMLCEHMCTTITTNIRTGTPPTESRRFTFSTHAHTCFNARAQRNNSAPRGTVNTQPVSTAAVHTNTHAHRNRIMPAPTHNGQLCECILWGSSHVKYILRVYYISIHNCLPTNTLLKRRRRRRTLWPAGTSQYMHTNYVHYRLQLKCIFIFVVRLNIYVYWIQPHMHASTNYAPRKSIPAFVACARHTVHIFTRVMFMRVCGERVCVYLFCGCHGRVRCVCVYSMCVCVWDWNSNTCVVVHLDSFGIYSIWKEPSIGWATVFTVAAVDL